MKKSSRVVGVLLSAIALWGTSACERPAEQAGDSRAELASAAVLILELSEEPAVRIGGSDERSEYHIQYTSGALRLSDGRIVVADDGTRELRYFDAQGTHLRTAGGQGGGPGEFQRLRTIARLKADTIFAWDLIQRRGSLFSPEGDIVRTTSLSSLDRVQTDLQLRLPQHLLNGSTIHALHSDRVFVEPFVSPNLQAIPSTHLMQDTLPLFLMDRNGDNPTELGPFRGAEWFTHRVTTRLPLGENLRLAAGEDVLYVGSTRDREIRILSGSDGAEIGRISLPLQARASSPEDIETVGSRMVERIVPNARESMVAYVEAVPWPATLPVFGGLRVASDARLWVQAYRLPDEPSQEWLIFEPSGAHVASLTLDGSFELLDAGADYVIVQITDDLGLEELRLYTLQQQR